jgi:arylsulfatase A-like enzyme
LNLVKWFSKMRTNLLKIMKKPLNRRSFIKNVGFGAAGLAFSGLPQCREQSVEQPNILLLMTDYQTGRDGPALGHDFLDMPAFDRLCREGAVFERYYSTAPICMPARYSLITGQYPHTHGEQDNQGRWVPEGSPLLMEHLKNAGYYTMGVGKMHFFPWDRMAGFDRRIIADRKGNGKADNQRQDDYARFLARSGLTRFDYLKRQWTGKYPGVYDWPFAESQHIDAFVGDRAREVIERDELPEPWFMWVSFNGPHNPWDPPERFARPYRNLTLPLGRTFPGELSTKPRDHTRLRYNYTPQVVDSLDRDPERRREVLHAIRAGHYGNLTFIDRYVERILEALEKKNLLDKTLILSTSDHGCHLGSHDLIHKGTHYDDSARVPFVVRYPGRVKPQRIKGFAGHVDLMPTLLSVAGARLPAELEGTDLFPLLTEQTKSVQNEAVIEIRNSTSIVTEHWKLGVYPQDGNEGDLYDLTDDPDELSNLFDHPDYRKIREDLLARMLAKNPFLAAEMEKGTSIEESRKSVYILKEKAELPRQEAPVVAGKTFVIKVELQSKMLPELTEKIVEQIEGRTQNGYSLALFKGRPVFTAWHWGEATEVLSPASLPAGRSRIQIRYDSDGSIVLQVEGKIMAQGRAPGPLPVRPGRITEFSAATLRTGSFLSATLQIGDNSPEKMGNNTVS